MYSIFYVCASKSAFDLHYFVMDESRKDAEMINNSKNIEMKLRKLHKYMNAEGNKNRNRWSGKLDALQQLFINTGVAIVLHIFN